MLGSIPPKYRELVVSKEHSEVVGNSAPKVLKKERGVFTNCLQLVNHTSDSSLPIKGKSSDGLPAEVLTGRFLKLSPLVREFQRTHFATEHSRQVCCFVNATTLLPSPNI